MSVLKPNKEHKTKVLFMWSPGVWVSKATQKEKENYFNKDFIKREHPLGI